MGGRRPFGRWFPTGGGCVEDEQQGGEITKKRDEKLRTGLAIIACLFVDHH